MSTFVSAVGAGLVAEHRCFELEEPLASRATGHDQHEFHLQDGPYWRIAAFEFDLNVDTSTRDCPSTRSLDPGVSRAACTDKHDASDGISHANLQALDATPDTLHSS